MIISLLEQYIKLSPDSDRLYGCGPSVQSGPFQTASWGALMDNCRASKFANPIEMDKSIVIPNDQSNSNYNENIICEWTSNPKPISVLHICE